VVNESCYNSAYKSNVESLLIKMDKFSKAFLVLIDRVIIGLIIGCIALILAGEIQTKLLAISFENARNTALLLSVS